MRKILLVEDEEDLAEIILDNLEAEGYDTKHAPDGSQGRTLWQSYGPDLVVLDVMLPETDGLSLCREMREHGDLTPVLFLSAKGQLQDRVQGLAAGGDDYMVKPFHLPEFLMRIHTMLRRKDWHEQAGQDTTFSFAGHQIDLARGEAHLADGRQVRLSTEERRLLDLFSRHPGEVLDRDFLLDALWSDGVYPSTRKIEKLVQQLRQHFEPQPDAPLHFVRLSGIRFRFQPEGESD